MHRSAVVAELEVPRGGMPMELNLVTLDSTVASGRRVAWEQANDFNLPKVGLPVIVVSKRLVDA